jgi:hypothetical protein
MHDIIKTIVTRIIPGVSVLALTLVFTVLLPSQSPQGVSVIAQVQAHSRDALVRKCRKAVFRQYGQRRIRHGRKVRSLNNKFSIGAVDSCVANGGRVI